MTAASHRQRQRSNLGSPPAAREEGDDVRAGHDRPAKIHSFHAASVRSIVAINTDLASN
jgi:hypothetical protein